MTFIYILKTSNNPHTHTHKKKKLTELINKFSKITRYKIKIQKLVLFQDTSDEQFKMKTEKTFPFIIALKA